MKIKNVMKLSRNITKSHNMSFSKCSYQATNSRVDIFPATCQKRKREESIKYLEKALGLKYQNSTSVVSCRFPLEHLSTPLGQKKQHRLTKRLCRIQNWGMPELFLYSIIMLGRLGENEWIELLRNKDYSGITSDHLDIIMQSVILVDGVSRGQVFFHSIREFLHPIHLRRQHSLKINLAFAVGSLYEDDLDGFCKWFKILRDGWWPLSSALYTQIISGHIEILLRHGRSLDSKIEESKSIKTVNIDESIVPGTIKSLRWVLKHMHLSGIDISLKQYYLLIMGYAQAGLLQKSLRLYYWFIKKGGIPTNLMLDVLLDRICRLPVKSTIKTNQLGMKTKPQDMASLLLSHYNRFKVIPSLHAYTLLIRFTANHNYPLAQQFYQVALIQYGQLQMQDFQKAFLTRGCPSKVILKRVQYHMNRWKNWDNIWQALFNDMTVAHTCTKRLDWVFPNFSSNVKDPSVDRDGFKVSSNPSECA